MQKRNSDEISKKHKVLPPKETLSTPSNDGAFTTTHSRKLMNDGDNIMSNKKQSEYTISRNAEPSLNPPG